MIGAPATLRLLLASLAAGLLVAAPLATAAKPKRDRHRVDIAGVTKSVGRTGDGAIDDRGSVTGKPFRPGKIRILVHLGPDSAATGTFRIRDRRGTARGTIDMKYVIDFPAGEITFTGTAAFTGGKGAYKRIRGKDLKAYDHNTLDGQNGTVELKGFVTY